MTKFKNSNFEETQKHKLWVKTNWDKTLKSKLWKDSNNKILRKQSKLNLLLILKTKIMRIYVLRKLRNLNCDQTKNNQIDTAF